MHDDEEEVRWGSLKGVAMHTMIEGEIKEGVDHRVERGWGWLGGRKARELVLIGTALWAWGWPSKQRLHHCISLRTFV